MELNLIIEDAISNPIKFTLDGAPVDQRATFDQRRYAQTKNTTVDPDKVYNQLFENTDPIRIQYYSNFPLNRSKIVDCHGVEYGAPMIPSVAVEYRNKVFRSGCKFASVGGKMFIFFTQNFLYLDEDFTETGDLVGYNGRLPNINAVAGDVFRYSFDGITFMDGQITGIHWDVLLQAEGYLTDVDLTLVNPIDGFVEILYDEKPANLYTQLISLVGLAPGKYFIRREHGLNNYDVSFTSEPIQVAEYFEDTLAIEYRHLGTYNRADIWNYVYLFDWSNVLRIPAAFFKFAPAGEMEVDVNDFGTPRILRAVPYRQLEINFFNMPSWLADKIQMALAHDIKIINGYEWEVENFGQFELVDRMDLGTYTVVLRQKDDRTKKTDQFTYSITAEFVPPTQLALPFDGVVANSEFQTNTGGVFHFVTVPAWITPNKSTFVNGDLLQFTIAPNATGFNRVAVLTAVCDTIDGLTAEMTFQQLLDDTPAAEFLNVSSLAVVLGYDNGANELLTVVSSGDWDISYSGAFAFTASKESGFTKVRITAPSANPGPTERTGVVRLTLQSNPTIFQDVNVTQSAPPPPPPQFVGVDFDDWAPPPHHTSKNFTVTTEPGCQWQATSSEYWIHVDWSLRTGSGVLNVTLDYPEVYDTPRDGVVTLINILDPYDQIVITIAQN